MEKISLSELVAINSTPQARALVVRNGYAPARNLKDLSMKLSRLIADQREDGLMQVASIHPHKDLIEQYIESIKPKVEEKKSRFDYAEEYIDANGQSSLATKEDAGSNSKMPDISSHLPYIGFGIFALTALVIATKS